MTLAKASARYRMVLEAGRTSPDAVRPAAASLDALRHWLLTTRLCAQLWWASPLVAAEGDTGVYVRYREMVHSG